MVYKFHYVNTNYSYVHLWQGMLAKFGWETGITALCKLSSQMIFNFLSLLSPYHPQWDMSPMPHMPTTTCLQLPHHW